MFLASSFCVHAGQRKRRNSLQRIHRATRLLVFIWGFGPAQTNEVWFPWRIRRKTSLSSSVRRSSASDTKLSRHGAPLRMACPFRPLHFLLLLPPCYYHCPFDRRGVCLFCRTLFISVFHSKTKLILGFFFFIGQNNSSPLVVFYRAK